jgi:hypothetical protein
VTEAQPTETDLRGQARCAKFACRQEIRKGRCVEFKLS